MATYPRFVVAARDIEDMELARVIEAWVNGPDMVESIASAESFLNKWKEKVKRLWP